MRPRSAVLMCSKDGQIEHYALYFSAAKARRAYQDALVRNREGWSTLYLEDGGQSSMMDVSPRIVEFLDQLGTRAEPTRTSFLNLTPAEITEPADRFKVPGELIVRASRQERDVAEGLHGYGAQYSERTKARMRIYLPRFILKRIFYS